MSTRCKRASTTTPAQPRSTPRGTCAHQLRRRQFPAVSPDRAVELSPSGDNGGQDFRIGAHFNVGDHGPDRASWNCAQCGTRFPCGTAQQLLKAALGSVPLAIFMWAAFDAAVLDLGETRRQPRKCSISFCTGPGETC